MKKGFQKILMILIVLCVFVSMFNFFLPVDVVAQGNGCYGIVFDQPAPPGWYCYCLVFVDCWKRIDP
jgi:hypothetical protein